MTIQPVNLTVLFTNAFLENWSGSELYIRDLAVQLIRRHHTAICFSPRTGALAEQMRANSIPVIDRLDGLLSPPNLIHGQHHLETMIALAHFSETPAVYFCHGWLPWEERVPVHPRILHYVAVSDALRERLEIEFGISPQKITTILNFYDPARFTPRPPLPNRPARALIYDNSADESNFVPAIRQACADRLIQLEVIGLRSGAPTHTPEDNLKEFDLIFARGRSALESLAVGAAVICCGPEGLGGLVTPENLDWMRRNNFGIRVMNRPLSVDAIGAEIDRYRAPAAAAVCQTIRESSGIDAAVDQILAVYQQAILSWKEQPHRDTREELSSFSSYLHGLAADMHHFYQVQYNASRRIDYLTSQLQQVYQHRSWRIISRLMQTPWLVRLYMMISYPFRRLSNRQHD